MQRINAFVYPNKVEIQADIDVTLTTRNRIVYAKTVKVHKGIDNTIVFNIKNSDQKPINLTGHSVYLSIVSDNGINAELLEVQGTIQDAARGIFTVVIYQEELSLLDQEFYNYTVRLVNSSNVEIPVYSDDFYQVRGQLQIFDGYTPAFRNSANLTLTDLEEDVVVTSSINGSYPSGFNFVHSFQLYFDNFTGTVTPQVTTEPIVSVNNVNWIDLEALEYMNQNDTDYTTITGNYSAIRFRISVTSGSVTKILSRS
jgi:hypothetical protein